MPGIGIFAILFEDGRDTGVKDNASSQFLQPPYQGRGHIRGVVGNRKYPAPSFHLDRAAVFFKKVFDHLVVKAIDGAVEKLVVSGHISKKILCGTVIGQVAAPFSGDIYFFAGFFRFFENRHFMSVLRSCHSGHEACGTGADHDHIFMHFSFSIVIPSRKTRKGRFPYSRRYFRHLS